MGLEIEKKYLANRSEKLTNFIEKHTPISIKYIEQTYELPDENTEIRLRKVVENGFPYFFKTIKRGEGLVREEIENEISAQEYFGELSKQSTCIPILKLRRTYQIGVYLVEVDFFFNAKLNDIVLVEIEFEDVDSANSFDAFSTLDFIFSDVTEEKFFKNKNLWVEVNS